MRKRSRPQRGNRENPEGLRQSSGRQEERKALLQLGTSLLGTLDPHEVATLTARAVAEAMGVPVVEVRLADEERGGWSCKRR